MSFYHVKLFVVALTKTVAVMSPSQHDDAGIFRDSGAASAGRSRTSFTSTFSEEKENGEMTYPRSKLSPEARYGSGASSGRGSPAPARGYRSSGPPREESTGIEPMAPPPKKERPVSSLPQPSGAGGGESWRRAAEVTSQLKARIEQMKVRRLAYS
jgi:cytoskeleton-associated protein 5